MQNAPHETSGQRTSANLDPAEVDRFERLAGEWWDPNGKLRPLHQQGPARLGFVREALVRHFDRPSKELKPLRGLSILDVGCGGGLVSEPLARLGANVTGIDPTVDSIAVARRHAEAQGLAIAYRSASVEELQAAGETFDAAVCMEVIEHVPDPAAFVRSLGGAGAPRRLAHRLDPQPDLEVVRAGHHRRRVRARMAAPRYARLEPVRHHRGARPLPRRCGVRRCRSCPALSMM